jgi:hypothetical protein
MNANSNTNALEGRLFSIRLSIGKEAMKMQNSAWLVEKDVQNHKGGAPAYPKK